MPLWILGADISKAYDENSFDTILECCSRRNVPPNVAAYLMKDLRECILEFNLDGLKSGPVKLRRALFQGGKHSPALFIEVLSDILGPVWAFAQVRGWGFRIGGLFVRFLVFADNIWVLASARGHMDSKCNFML